MGHNTGRAKKRKRRKDESTAAGKKIIRKNRMSDRSVAVSPTHTPTAANGKKASPDAKEAAAHSKPAAEIATRSGYQIQRSELVRVMVQALQDIGCPQSARALETESGVRLEEGHITKFRQGVLSGDWDSVLAILPRMRLVPKRLAEARAVVSEQQFLEQLEGGDMKSALATLRGSLAPSNLSPGRIKKLSSLLMYADPAVLRKEAGWDGADGESRTRVLRRLQALSDPDLVVPHSRLLDLVDHAISHQVSQCQFHNTRLVRASLLHDHVCTLGQIPRRCRAILETQTDEVWCVRFSHDGKRIAAASRDRSIVIYSAIRQGDSTWRAETVLPNAHPAAICAVRWAPDNRHILSLDEDSNVKLWALSAGGDARCKLTLPADASSDGKAAAGRASTEKILSVCWAPDGRRFASGGLAKVVTVRNLDGRAVASFSADSIIRELASVKDSDAGRLLVVGSGSNPHISAYDWASLRRDPTVRIQESSPVTSACASRDGRYLLLSVARPAGVRLWNIATGECVRRFEGLRQSRYVVHACFGGVADSFVLSGSEDSQVHVWHRASGDLLATLPGHSGTVNSVAWSPVDPHTFVSASDDHTVRVWGTDGSGGDAKVNGDAPAPDTTRKSNSKHHNGVKAPSRV